MKDDAVGVRALKATLSECLRRVRAGSRLTITDRGRPIALIVPAGTADEHAWAERLVTDGLAKWGGGRPIGLARRIKARGTPTSTMVLEDRR